MVTEIYLSPTMTTDDIQFNGKDPGTAKYGNFINYYTFHTADQRTANLHPKMFPTVNNEPLLCLDIGCNTGELTRELYTYLKHIYPINRINVLAVDIDPILIERANEYKSESLTFLTANVMTEDGSNVIQNYLEKHNKTQFDITFCFSVTLWIHINNGDEGLLQFLKFIRNVSKCIVIESQPWNCYRNAQRRLKKSGSTFPLYEKLKIRSNVEQYIEDILIESYIKVYESSSSSWNRRIQSFQIKTINEKE